jgi:hypothetical protein
MMSVPLIIAAPAPARYITVAAISHGLAKRRVGMARASAPTAETLDCSDGLLAGGDLTPISATRKAASRVGVQPSSGASTVRLGCFLARKNA